MTLPLGTDTSFHQKLVDWKRAFLAGVVFAYIRWGQREDWHDSYAKRSWLNCAETPIYRGAYWVWDERDGDGADEHMAGVLEVARDIGLDSYDGELPFVIDLELEPVDWDELLSFALQLFSWTGRWPDIYTGSWFYDRVDPLPDWLGALNHWLTGYNDIGPDIWGPLEGLDPFVTCWQDSPAWQVDWTASGYSDRDRWWAGEAHLKEYAEMGNTVVNADDLREWISDNEFAPGPAPPPAGRFSLIWPCADPKVVTQPYGINKHLYEQFGLPGHEGIDLRAPNHTPVFAAADGVVIRVEIDPDDGAYGIHVRLEHPHPDGPFKTVYAHFQTDPTQFVEVGDHVNAGQQIGWADNTGNSSGAHLHMTLKKVGDGSTWMNTSDIVDPTPYMVDLFPGDRWAVDVGGNFRTSPELGNNLIRFIPPNSLVEAVDFTGEWWQIIFQNITGWFWNPGYKLMPI